MSGFVDCNGKKSFPTFELAAKAAKLRRAKKRSPYHCTYCGKFHLGGHFKRRDARRDLRESFA